MVKKEIYLQFGSKRNKCITFESKSGISDWDNLREIMRQKADKDEDLKRRLQNCNNIIFQKYKVKKSTGEKILVDVDEDEETEVEHEADLTVVFCHVENISKNEASENEIQTQNIVNQSSSSCLFIDLSSDIPKCHEILNKNENDINTQYVDDEIIATYEIDKKKEESEIKLQKTDTETKLSTLKPTENSLKRKLNITKKPEKVHCLYFCSYFCS